MNHNRIAGRHWIQGYLAQPDYHQTTSPLVPGDPVNRRGLVRDTDPLTTSVGHG
jgi:hypothetical protein